MGFSVDFFPKAKYNTIMEKKIKIALADSMQGFHLPRYADLPDVGLYLEQTVKYINQCLQQLGCIQVTGSMIRNYVKQGLAPHPVQKQYHAEQIAYLIGVTILKQVAPLEHINKLFFRQKSVYSCQVAYDYFCTELENVLYYRFGLKDSVESVGVTSSIEKEMLSSAVTAVSHIIYFNACFRQLSPQ